MMNEFNMDIIMSFKYQDWQYKIRLQLSQKNHYNSKSFIHI